MSKHLILSIVTCSLLVGRLYSQSLDSTLKIYGSQYEQEKVHIHFDKDAYLPGETIWMKAYILNGFKPSQRSKNLYFDWTDVNGNLLLHSVSPIMESVSISSFAIPAGYKTGIIHLRVYTRWMLNFDSDFLFDKDIPVLAMWDGTNENPEKRVGSIQFFPEGGDMVNGLSSIVAFEATDQHGRPVHVSGTIKNPNNEIIDSFSTIHDGMGSFKLHPVNNEKYTAYWADEFGESHVTPLPQSRTTGVVIRVNPALDKIYFQVERPADCSDNFKSLTIRGISHDKLSYTSAIDLKGQTLADGTVSTDQLPDGVTQLTIFDADGSPLAERVVFVNNHQFEFSTQINNELVNLNRKGRNEISIEIPDDMPANLSVSVTDAGLGYDSSNSIFADFLLRSDIRGSIVDPAYYLSNNADNKSRNLHVDLLMRTHGWRRFKWEDAIAGNFPVIKFPAESDYMVLKGQITPVNTPFERNDSIALLMVTKDHKKHMFQLPLAADGSFQQKGVFFYDTLQILYRLNHSSKMNSHTALNFQTGLIGATTQPVRALSPNFPWLKVPDLILDKEQNGELTEMVSYARLLSGSDYAFMPNGKKDSLRGGAETALHYLQSNFPNLKFPASTNNASTGDTRYAVYTINQGTSQVAEKGNINLLLDGVLVSADELRQITMKDILFIKFLEKTSKVNPTLLLTSRQSIDQNNIINNKTGLVTLKGYTPAKEFYSPQYGVNAQTDQIADLRSTLYWNPLVQLDKNHTKIKIVFYNNDVSNKFRVVVEGFNKEGKFTRMVEQIVK